MSELFKPITSLDAIPPSPQGTKKERSSNRTARRGPQRLNRYDAASTDDENRKHWANADALSANAGNSPGIRYNLRIRSRYETANNGYARGLVRGQANDCIGTGPKLQLVLPETWVDPDFQREIRTPDGIARIVEQKWQDWCDLIGFADDLHTMDRSESREGEVFAVFMNNPALPETCPQLDLRLVEADQVQTPDLDPTDHLRVDGIRFDDHGNAISYDILKRHPGDVFLWGIPWEYDTYPAHRVIHLYDRDRAGQARGIPALTPGLPLFAQLRRYTLASLGAAELAAMIAGVIESENTPPVGGDEEAPEFEEMDKVPFARNALLTLPSGMKAHAFKSEQPAPSYKEFKGEVLTEAGRGMNAPRNISTGSSAEYNYSSGRLDHIPYQTGIKIRRDRIRRHVINRVFAEWLNEARLIPGYLPDGLPPIALWRWQWRWDGFASIDPIKDATANQIKLESGQTTLDDICAEQGKDWEELLEQQAREMRLREKLGLPPLGAVAAPKTNPNSTSLDTNNATDTVPAGGSVND